MHFDIIVALVLVSIVTASVVEYLTSGFHSQKTSTADARTVPKQSPRTRTKRKISTGVARYGPESQFAATLGDDGTTGFYGDHTTRHSGSFDQSLTWARYETVSDKKKDSDFLTLLLKKATTWLPKALHACYAVVLTVILVTASAMSRSARAFSGAIATMTSSMQTFARLTMAASSAVTYWILSGEFSPDFSFLRASDDRTEVSWTADHRALPLSTLELSKSATSLRSRREIRASKTRLLQSASLLA